MYKKRDHRGKLAIKFVGANTRADLSTKHTFLIDLTCRKFSTPY